MKHPVIWHTPAPLWNLALQDSNTRRFHRPELLRFASDSFMEDLQQTLETDAATISTYVTRRETWQEGKAGWLPDTAVNGAETFDPNTPLKLYQPAHQRFYLVSASLVCRVRGLPDKTVDTANEETVSFVVRRLVPQTNGQTVQPNDPTTFYEYGWFDHARWKRITAPEEVDIKDDADQVLREERLPMFPFSFSENGNGRKRRLLTGFLPSANRETYEAAPRDGATEDTAQDIAADDLADIRKTVFQASIAQFFISLRTAMGSSGTNVATNEVRDVLVFALLDLAEFLEANLDEAWAKIKDNAVAISDADQQAVYAALQAVLFTGTTWAEALDSVDDHKDEVVEGTTQNALTVFSSHRQSIYNAIYNLGFLKGLGASFCDLVMTALDKTPPPKPETIPGGPSLVDSRAGSLYVARCVYERPGCSPFLAPVVSAPSQVFQLASFFDVDAPVRPLRITMPIDTSMAGLRKSPKGVSFLFSDQLRNQLQRLDAVRSITDVEEGNIQGEGGFDLGMICSFSISIIFICAFVLMLIIMWVLNIVFWWSAFFKICFPIPLKK